MTALDKLKELQAWSRENDKPKSARAHAQEIIAMKGKDGRREALDKVPEDIRHIVKFFVCDFFSRRQKTALPDLSVIEKENA